MKAKQMALRELGRIEMGESTVQQFDQRKRPVDTRYDDRYTQALTVMV